MRVLSYPMPTDSKGITAFSLSPSGTCFSGSYDGRINAYDDAGVATPVSGPGHSNQVNSIAVAGERAFSAGMDDAVREIDVRSSSFTSRATSTASMPKSLAASVVAEGGSTMVYVATASDVQTLRDGKKIFSVAVNYDPMSIAVHGTTRVVAVGAGDNKVYLYKTDGEGKLDADGTLEERNRKPVTALAFSPDGSLLAVGDAGGKVLVYNVASKQVRSLAPRVSLFLSLLVLVVFCFVPLTGSHDT
jgi:WD repeat-containing protein 1 (actin-interacting protein 1)